MWRKVQFSSVAQSCPTLQPHGLQHTRLPCPSPIPGAHSNLCPSNYLILYRPLLLLPSVFLCSNESALHITWWKYWSFSFNISPSNEHSGLIFRMDWLDLLAVQGTLRSSVIWELLHLCPSTRWQHIPELGPSGTGCAFTQSPTSLQGSVLELGVGTGLGWIF